MTRSGAERTIALVSAAASLAVAIGATATIRPGHWAAALLLAAALWWSALPSLLDAVTARRPHVASVDREATVTAIIRLGEEPAEVAQAAISIAASRGPAIVVCAGSRADLPHLVTPGVTVCAGPTLEQAVARAASLVRTDAVVIYSASAFARWEACQCAAARLGGDVGWVVGRSRSFDSDDGYAPEARESVAAGLRRRARAAGLDAWERDAVIVRADLLRARPFEPGRPWGAWLRSARRDGFSGEQLPDTLTDRASAAGADAFWPATVARQRAVAADLGDAVTSSARGGRLAAFGLLLRELHAYPLLVWALAPVWIGSSGAFPFRVPPWVAVGAAAGAAVLRWFAVRFVTQTRLRPAQDAFAVAYDVPGSLLALPAALTRRVRPTRMRLPDRPHVWVALLLVLLLALPLVRRSPGGAPSRVAVALALVHLALLWVLALRALLQRTWRRRAFRFRFPIPVRIGGIGGTTVDLSPSGIAVRGAFGGAAVGDVLAVELATGGGAALSVVGTVVDVRHRGGTDVLALALRLEPEQRAPWYTLLYDVRPRRRGRGRARGARTPISREAPLVARVAERAVITLVGVFALFAASTLLLLFVGYRPLVVRSGSMVPALRVGDLAIVKDVPAGAVRVGDIVTFEDPEGRGDTITHRVQGIDLDDGLVHFETRGDANAASEFWSATVDEVVGRYWTKVPAVGRVLVTLASGGARALLGGAAVVIVAAPWMYGRSRAAVVRSRGAG